MSKKTKANYVQAYLLGLTPFPTALAKARWEDLIEYLSPCCIASPIDNRHCFIVADCEMLSAAELKSKCEYFLQGEYELETVGMLGPYKRVF